MENLEACTASLSGTPALPTEILSKIFLQCADIDSSSLTPANTIDVPLLLTKVCRSWRTIAIGTKCLWSRLYLDIKPNAQHQTALVSTWLTRSGTYPLQMYIMWSNPPFTSSHEVLDILIDHSYQWRTVYFFLPMSAYKCLAGVRGKLPMLAELSLGTHEPPDIEPVLKAFEVAPKLRSLECVNLHPYMFEIPWAHLSHIPIMDVAVEDALDILHRAPRLETGSFICTDEREVWTIPPAAPLRHTHLRELAVLAPEWHQDIETRELFRFLTAPRLQSLRICNITWPFGSHLVPFLAKVDALESLYLRKTALSEAEVLAVLELSSSLKHLTLLSSSMFTMATDVLIEQLTWRPASDKPLTPKLETLEISLPGALTMAFVELLESRWDTETEPSPVARLMKVEVSASDDYDEDIIARLEALAQSGMMVIIGSTDVPLEDGLEYMSASSSRGRDDTI
ncbi:hypothetical protein FPV67DRAFT_1672332 [Lyophyllum atratum]|nr:hypothetical protein FPV67DRAFT_1672332 [Lyophyllum atratum]